MVAKADNMLSILWLLYSRKRMTAAELSAELEISVRTVYRHIDALCASGVPIVADAGHDGGYHLPENFKRTPLFFERNEIKAIFHAAEFAQQAGYPHSDALDSALMKLKRSASPIQVEHLMQDSQRFGVISLPRGGPVQPWLRMVEEAVENQNTLEILYQKGNATEPEWRKVDPYGIVYDSGRWYIAVYCHLRSAMRDFRVDRIIDLKTTNEHFTVPPGFSLQEYFSMQAFIEHLQTGPFTDVTITGTVWTLTSMCDHWYIRHCVKEQIPGKVILQLNDPAMKRIAPMLLSYGVDIEVIYPPTLREHLRDVSLSWAERYRDGDKNSVTS